MPEPQKPTNKPAPLGAGTWRKGDRIMSDEQANELNRLIGLVDELDSVIECYVTGGFDDEGQFVDALDELVRPEETAQ